MLEMYLSPYRRMPVVPAAIVLSFLILAAGCGGGSSSDPDGDDGNDPPTDELTLESAESVLTASSRADSLFLDTRSTHGRAAATAAALAFLEAAEGIEAAGVAPDSTIWALCDNGLMLAVFEPGEGALGGPGTSAPPAPRDAIHATPAGGKDGGEAISNMVVLTPFAHDFGNEAEIEAAEEVDACFGDLDDGATVYVDGQVTVDRFAEVLSYGPGVLLITTHGCWVPAIGNANWVALVTGENYATTQAAQRIVADYGDMATAIGDLRQVVIIAHGGRHWLAVTPAFILSWANFDMLEGMTNGSKSVVFLNACHGGETNSRVPAAFLNRGVDKVLAWSNIVHTNVAFPATREFFRAAVDTCTIREAHNLVSSSHDSVSTADLLFFEDSGTPPMMLRAQMPFIREGAFLHGYAVGVAIDDGVTTVNCVAGEQMDLPVCNVIVHVPGTAAGSWNCVSDDHALISVLDFGTGRYYLVQKDYVGVGGEIEVTRYDDDLISGTFHGTLGWWSSGSPTEDPPDATIEIVDGVIKHVGTRY